MSLEITSFAKVAIGNSVTGDRRYVYYRQIYAMRETAHL